MCGHWFHFCIVSLIGFVVGSPEIYMTGKFNLRKTSCLNDICIVKSGTASFSYW